jgi:3-hydroxybutyrate dehydrogenase
MYNVLLTGAASGIGAGVAAELARAGYHVIISDMKLSDAERVASELQAAGHSAQAVQIDVTSDDSVEAALGAEAMRARPADVLINNAGLQHVAPLEEFPIQKWDFLIQVMLTGAARLTRAVLPGMRRRGFGRIVNVGSIHSLVASPYKSAYVAAKHGLDGFSKAIALETADTDITINTICPSYVRTPLVDQQIAAQARTQGIAESEVIDKVMLAPMPKHVFIGMDEIAGTVMFLISRAARNITGHTLVLDGGWTVR